MWFFLLFLILIIVRHRFFWKINKADMDKKYGVLFAHRGITKNYPENTLNAYLDAVKFGYKAIELDVVVSKDKQLICSHNHDLEYETNGKGKFKDFDVFDLKELKTGIYSHPKNTQQICTLKEVLKMVPVDVFLNIELKTEYWHDLKIAKILNDYRKSKYGIIHCCYKLGEGFDESKIDTVCISENMFSNIRIVQSLLRPHTKNKNHQTLKQ